MPPIIANLFQLPSPLPLEERFEILVEGHRLRIERILSLGQTTPLGEWYDQDLDEWVILLQGEAELAYEGNTRQRLQAGDYVLIPAHCRHRVEYTSTEPPCIWLAVHGVLQSADEG
ncbi:cupin domain-containing protein [Altericista sp. CCNU0014]|uniref:cupin domain-containing protein n=1 Tax=Altericista sp. CCNU0014 TaxID=3082949 RepID=UPI00384F4F79